MEELVGGVQPMLETAGAGLHAPLVPTHRASCWYEAQLAVVQTMKVTIALAAPTTRTTIPPRATA